MVDGERPVKVMIACSGLGHVARGFETFAQESFEALRGHPEVAAYLVKGAGPAAQGELVARTVRRDEAPARALGRALRRDPYVAEQLVFAARCLPLIASCDPDVIFFSDWAFGKVLGRWRSATGRRYRLLMSNGAAGPPPYDPAFDHIQQLTPLFMDLATAAGEPQGRHTLLPLGFHLVADERRPTDEETRARRVRLDLPVDRDIVLSVAALNVWSKRLDYLIREIAGLQPRPHLVLLGQPEAETEEVLALARTLLGTDGFTVRTVPAAEVADYYRAADALVLCSIYEGMGRVLVEALSHGLRVIAHDAHWARYVTGGHARLADLTAEGELRKVLRTVLDQPPEAAACRAGQRFAQETFGWEALTPRYVEMFRVSARRPGAA